MATENQGIMSLPKGGKEGPQAPQMGLDESYDAVKGGLQDASPEAAAALQQTMAQIMPQLDQLSDAQLDAMVQIFQYLHDHPEEYRRRSRNWSARGLSEKACCRKNTTLKFLQRLLWSFWKPRSSVRQATNAKPKWACPSLRQRWLAAVLLKQPAWWPPKVAGSDSMLAHITPREAALLRKHGGMGTINPATGLPEYGWFDDAVFSPLLLKQLVTLTGGAVNAVGRVVNGWCEHGQVHHSVPCWQNSRHDGIGHCFGSGGTWHGGF